MLQGFWVLCMGYVGTPLLQDRSRSVVGAFWYVLGRQGLGQGVSGDGTWRLGVFWICGLRDWSSKR